jgi:hypothetical protein
VVLDEGDEGADGGARRQRHYRRRRRHCRCSASELCGATNRIGCAL